MTHISINYNIFQDEMTSELTKPALMTTIASWKDPLLTDTFYMRVMELNESQPSVKRHHIQGLAMAAN